MRFTLALARKAIQIPFELPTQTQKIKSLYKRAYRNLEAWEEDFVAFRIEARLLREKFDVIQNETDIVKSRELLTQAEKELWENIHPLPLKFPTAPGGSAHEREAVVPDWLMDYWHPLEKAQYPEYFKRREQRKKEFVVWWEKQYGKPNPADGHH